MTSLKMSWKDLEKKYLVELTSITIINVRVVCKPFPKVQSSMVTG